MRPVSITVSSIAASQWIPVDYRQAPFSIGFGAKINSGTATYTVQHTFDNVLDPTVTPVAFNHPTVAAATANADGNYAFPVRAIRLNVTAGASPNVTLTILQGNH